MWDNTTLQNYPIEVNLVLFLIICSPYLSADLRLMASSFNTTVNQFEDELMALILDGQIQARIDSHNKVMLALFVILGLM